MKSSMDKLEELYQTNNIRSAILICNTVSEAMYLQHDFKQNDHSVVLFRIQEDIDDERAYAGYTRRLQQFRNGDYRILIITYADWFEYRSQLEPFIVNHNLLIMQDIESQPGHIVLDWITDARRRGFVETDLPYFVHFNEENV